MATTNPTDPKNPFRAILDALPMPMFVIDNRGDILWMNVSLEVHTSPNRPRNLVELLVHPVEGAPILDRLRQPQRMQNHAAATVDAIARYFLVSYRLVFPDRPDDRFLIVLQERIAGTSDLGHLADALQRRNEEIYGKSAIDETLESAVPAQVDDLTGLPDQRALEAQLERHWQRAHTFGIGISLLAFDIDCPDPDEEDVAQLARVVSRARMRPTDLLARLDDGAFALLLPDTPDAGARIVRGRLLEFLGHTAPCPVVAASASILPDAATGWPRLLDDARAALREARSAPSAPTVAG